MINGPRSLAEGSSMRVFWTVLVLAALAAAPASAANSWTLMFYLIGDDAESAGVEDAAIGDLDILAENGPPPGVAYLAQVDRGKKLTQLMRDRYSDPNYSGVMRYNVTKGKWNTVAKPGEMNSGDPKTLLDFIRWGMQTAPADRYMVVISSHGSGTLSWRGTGSTSSQTPGAVDLSTFVAYDDTDNDCLTIFEIAKVLDAVKADRGGKKLEILGLDACYSGSIEALHAFREGCDVMMASPELVPMSGFAYRTPLAHLTANPRIEPEKLAEVMVKAFIDSRDSGDEVMGAWRTSAADALVGAIDRLSIEMVRAQKEVGGFAVPNLTKYNENYWDLKRLCESLASGTDFKGATNAQAIRDAAKEVLDARQQAMISLWYMGSYAQSKVGGLSLYWPDKESHRKYRAFYRALSFSKSAHWDEYVDLRELGIAAD
jgi:hypothetical protein